MSPELRHILQLLQDQGELYRRPKHWNSVTAEAQRLDIILQTEWSRGERQYYHLDFYHGHGSQRHPEGLYRYIKQLLGPTDAQ